MMGGTLDRTRVPRGVVANPQQLAGAQTVIDVVFSLE